MAEKEELHQGLLAWLTAEMNFQTTAHYASNFSQLPSENELKVLCQKPLDDVWKYVLKHVRSVQTVRRMKGNIAVKRSFGSASSYQAQHKQDTGKDEENKRVQREKKQLTSELAVLQTDVNHLRKEMSHVSREVSDAERTYQTVCERLRDLQRKGAILEVVRKSSNEKIATYAEYTRRIDDRTSAITQRSDNGGKNYVKLGRSKDSSELLETETCRDVRLTSQAIGDFLKKSLDEPLSDKSSMERFQRQLWEKMDTTASAHSARALVSALVKNTEHATKNLREETLGVNIAKDAQALQFSYANTSGLQDLSAPTSVEKSVEQLLLAGNLEHVMRWLKEQEYKNEEWKLTARLDDMMTEIHKHVQRVMGEHPRNVQIAKGYIDALIQLAVERTASPCLRTEADGLIDKIQRAKEARRELRLKYEQIQSFKSCVEKKQIMIGTLAKQNAAAPSRLENQKKQITSYITSRSLDSHAREVKHLTDGMKDSLVAELEKFSTLFLPCLLTVSLDCETRVCVFDLSISPSIHPLAREKIQLYSDVCTALNFPEYKCPDSLFIHLLNAHDKLQELDCIHQRRESMVRSAKAAAKTTDDVDKFVDLCLKAVEHDRAQCEKLLPALTKAMKNVSSSMAKIPDIKMRVTEWWEQPAQYTTPWMVTEGMTFDQWMQRWRVAVTHLNKRMLAGQSSLKK